MVCFISADESTREKQEGSALSAGIVPNNPGREGNPSSPLPKRIRFVRKDVF